MAQRMKDQKSGSSLARNQDFVKGEGLEPQVKKFTKISKLGAVASKFLQLNKRITDGGLGAKTPATGRFFISFWKK